MQYLRGEIPGIISDKCSSYMICTLPCEAAVLKSQGNNNITKTEQHPLTVQTLNLILVNLFWCDFVTPHTVWALFHFSFHCRLFFLWECMLESTLISITRYTCHSAIVPIIVITCTHPQNEGKPGRVKLAVILAVFWTFGPRRDEPLSSISSNTYDWQFSLL